MPSLGLKKDDEIDLDFSKFEGKKFFYDIIYNLKKPISSKLVKLITLLKMEKKCLSIKLQLHLKYGMEFSHKLIMS